MHFLRAIFGRAHLRRTPPTLSARRTGRGIGLLALLIGIPLALIAAAALTLALTLVLGSEKLPSMEVLTDYRPKVPLRIWTEDGVLIGEFGEERRSVVRIQDVPTVMKQAILAAEDDRFFEHSGVDLIGIARAALANVAVALEVGGVAAPEARERARALLARVGLARFVDRYPHQLSGGQRKRVALAQMLIRNPAILLMDEPFGPLDAQTRGMMGDLLLSLWSADRKAVLFVTHDLEEAISLADRVVVMSAGPSSRIMADHRIDLPRPRAINEIRLEPAFHEYRRIIWNDLRDEVMKAYGAQDDAGAMA